MLILNILDKFAAKQSLSLLAIYAVNAAPSPHHNTSYRFDTSPKIARIANFHAEREILQGSHDV
jgi:hypothetical protein